MTDRQDRPAPLAAVLTVTFTGSLSGGVFWQAIFRALHRCDGGAPSPSSTSESGASWA